MVKSTYLTRNRFIFVHYSHEGFFFNLLIKCFYLNCPFTQLEILEELSKKSSDETIEKVIKEYHPGSDLKAQKKAIGKFKK